MLQQRTGHDFKNYKRATVLRRIERRLQVNAPARPASYRRFLAARPGAKRGPARRHADRRDEVLSRPRAFEALEREVDPAAVRIGVATTSRCASGCPAARRGEEAYSLAMLLADEAARAHARRAGSGLRHRHRRDARSPPAAPASIRRRSSPTCRRRACAPIFTTEPGGYRVNKSLRETVLFALHNVLRDPPFSRLDLVSCRNLLIYLDRAAQQAVLEMFHFALQPGGYLFLGTSETVDAAARLFTPVDKKHRIYRANPTGRPLRAPAGAAVRPRRRHAGATPARRRRRRRSAHVAGRAAPGAARAGRAAERARRRTTTRSCTSRRAPSRFLRFAGGEPSHNLLHAVQPELRIELRTALFQALQLQRAGRRRRGAARASTGGRSSVAHRRCSRCGTRPGRARCCSSSSSEAEDDGAGARCRRRPRRARPGDRPPRGRAAAQERPAAHDDRAVRDLGRGAEGLERGAAGDQRGAALGDRGARDRARRSCSRSTRS